MTEKVAADFMDAVVDRLAERLLPVVTDRLKAQYPKELDRAMTIPEAAEYTGISERILYRMCQQGQIPHYRAGVIGSKKPKIQIRKSRLDAWIADQERESVMRMKEGADK